MDFDEAVSVHKKWKRKLRHCVTRGDGSQRPADVSLDSKCVLGQSIYGEGATYSSFPEYTRRKYEHAGFQSVAAELIKKANAGRLTGQCARSLDRRQFCYGTLCGISKRCFSWVGKRLVDQEMTYSAPEERLN